MKKRITESDHDKNMHISVCLHGNNLVSLAVNKNHRHSEVRAIKKARGSKVNTIINVRVKRKSGKIGLSLPCQNCAEEIRKAGIEKVIYSTDAGTFREWNPYDPRTIFTGITDVD